METGGLKTLLALEPKWTVCLNGLEFLTLDSSEISIDDSKIRFGPHSRKISQLEWLRPDVVRVRGSARFRTHADTITFYPGERLPAPELLRRKRRSFQTEIRRELCAYFGVRTVERETLFSDRRQGVGGAYPRFIVAGRGLITVDPDESSDVVNGLMRAALLWADSTQRPTTAIVPYERRHTISARLQKMRRARQTVHWLQWDGHGIRPLEASTAAPETHVQPLVIPAAAGEAARICALAPDLLQAVPHIAGQAISIRLRGIEIARVSDEGTEYPLGEPIDEIIQELAKVRRHDSRHPLSRAHEERWLESKIVGDIGRLIPSIDIRHIYPQVPSFVGQERNIIDLLSVTKEGRLVVIEIKASPDPDLPFQALDYWIAVERHREAGDFQNKGYFAGCNLRDEPTMLVLAAPLLSYHKTASRMISMLPENLPLMEIGINQTWKKQIKILRRQGMVS